MLYLKKLYLFICAIFLWNTADVVQSKYVYYSEVQRWIGQHKVIATWEQAKQNCERAGAILASPINEKLLKIMKSYIAVNGHRNSYFIGMNMRLGFGLRVQYVSVEGIDLDDMPDAVVDMIEQLDPLEGNCLSMNHDSIHAEPCWHRLPYICYTNQTTNGTMPGKPISVENTTIAVTTQNTTPIPEAAYNTTKYTELNSTTSHATTGYSEVTSKTPQATTGHAEVTITTEHPVVTSTTPRATTGYTEVTSTTPRATTGYAEVTPSTPRATIAHTEATSTTPSATTEKAVVTSTTPRATTGYADVTSTTPRATSGYAEVTPSTPRATTGYTEVTSTTPRAMTGYAEVTPSTPRATTAHTEATSTTPSATTEKTVVTSTTPRATTGYTEVTSTTPRASTGYVVVTSTTPRATTGYTEVTSTTPRASTGYVVVTSTTPRATTGYTEVTSTTPRASTGYVVVTSTTPRATSGYVVVTSTTQRAPDCNYEGYKYYPQTDSCYKINFTSEKWVNAKTACESEGGYLVILNDANEAKTVQQILRDVYVLKAWTGLQDETGHGNWRSVQGHSLNEIYQKNRFLRPRYKGRCAAIHATNGVLYEFYCTETMNFVCERDIVYFNQWT